MTSTAKIDTIDTVKTKITNNVKSLAQTLNLASEDLTSKGFQVPSGATILTAITFGSSSIEPESLAIDLLDHSKTMLDDIFSMSANTLTPEQVLEIQESLPSKLSPFVNPLLGCKDKDGKIALDLKLLNLLITYLKAFVKLSLKMCFFLQIPIAYDGKTYSFKSRTIEERLGIDLNAEIVKRCVADLPTTFE